MGAGEMSKCSFNSLSGRCLYHLLKSYSLSDSGETYLTISVAISRDRLDVPRNLGETRWRLGIALSRLRVSICCSL